MDKAPNRITNINNLEVGDLVWFYVDRVCFRFGLHDGGWTGQGDIDKFCWVGHHHRRYEWLPGETLAERQMRYAAQRQAGKHLFDAKVALSMVLEIGSDAQEGIMIAPVLHPSIIKLRASDTRVTKFETWFRKLECYKV